MEKERTTQLQMDIQYKHGEFVNINNGTAIPVNVSTTIISGIAETSGKAGETIKCIIPEV
jgi:hypothetical protein